jgi:hypothetical protein
MPAREHSDQQLLDGFVLADDDLSDLGPDLCECLLEVFGSGQFPLSQFFRRGWCNSWLGHGSGVADGGVGGDGTIQGGAAI